MLYDACLTDDITEKLKIIAGQFGWHVYRVGQFTDSEDDEVRARLELYVLLGYQRDEEIKFYKDFKNSF